MNYQQKTQIINSYFKYSAIYLVLAMVIPIFFNLTSEEESSLISYLRLFFVLFIFMSLTTFISGLIFRAGLK
jgi:hypothetical protein